MSDSQGEPFAAQPALTHLICAVAAPTQVWADPSGQVAESEAQGVYHGDIRALSRAVVTVDGQELRWGPWDAELGAAEGFVTSQAQGKGGESRAITVRRSRDVRPSGLREELSVRADGTQSSDVVVRVHLASDLASVAAVKAQAAVERQRVAEIGAGRVVWRTDGMTVTVTGRDADLDRDDFRPTLVWRLALSTDETVHLAWELTVSDKTAPVVSAARESSEWNIPQIECIDSRLPQLIAQSLDDLATLRMSLAAHPRDTFLAAGAPWYLTLFGRDALWAARMLLPLGYELAAGTLRVLARFQGIRTDPETDEEPGKILHEVRRDDQGYGRSDLELPPIYYGTVDATALWVCLLRDAWKWGMPDDEVRPLLPHLMRALSWITSHEDTDGNVFLRYMDSSGRGLSNQGWKDSAGAIRWMDGRAAQGPIALCEVQGYAYEAALAGAELIAAFDYGDSGSIRAWAEILRSQFQDAFWVENGFGRYPAIALDREGRAVDGIASNMGHLLGTGLICADEADLVVVQLTSEALDSGFGVRTLSTLSEAYDPESYHCGSVWPHDTAILISGLAKAGYSAAAAHFTEGLLAAASTLDYQLPELYSGTVVDDRTAPAPYAPACRPQAWSAASAIVVLSTVLGVTPDYPGRTVRLRPPKPSPIGPVSIRGIRIGGEPMDVTLGADGSVADLTYDGVCSIRY